MRPKNKHSGVLMSICSCILLCCILLSACSSDDISEYDSSIVMVKNANMSTYGTGFAVGVPGEAVDTIITSYSIVATLNGAPPKSAEIVINETEKNLSAEVVFYDSGRNIAILKLPKPSEDLKPLVLKSDVDYSESIYVRGYNGTGNIMSDFDKFNTTDIVQYRGNISTFDELDTVTVYKYSNEFNRALVGAPAIDENGNVIGMCAYSLNSMNTYSQYILSSAELKNLLSFQGIEFMTSEEVGYKTIIIASVSLGGLLFAAIIVVALVVGGKKRKKTTFVGKYIRITGGTLNGKMYKFTGKLTIGRDGTKCDVVYPVEEAGIGAVHCTLQMENGECYLVDNFSRYGTFLENGTKVASSAPYKIEDEKFAFYIAEPKNRFEFTDEKETGR